MSKIYQKITDLIGGTPLLELANYEKKIPLEWINDAHNGVKQELIDYVLPLIQGEPKLPKEDSLPRFAKLKKVLAKYDFQ